MKKIVTYITSKESKERIKKISFSDLEINTPNEVKIEISADIKKQTILGFGGAFTEASSSVYDKMKEPQKNEVMQSYFNNRNGNNYTFCRTHINSCDFSLGNYAYAETPNDINLKDFSIDHDKKSLIPFIKHAQNINQLKILASPWSPPAWMKTNGEMNNGGKLIEKYRQVWAEYYCIYIKEYEKAGIPIWGISIQNEPEAKQTWDSCLYTAEEERDFIKYFLGPSLHKNNLKNKKVVIWDHNRDIMVERAETVLNDKDAAKYVWGTGFHWYMGDHFDNVQIVHDKFPDKHLIFTEGTQEGGPHIGSWDLGERYATSIINDLNRWTVAWLDWNLILDERGGPNHVGNYCSAPVLYDTNQMEILYQSSYYYIGHFSRFIIPGDQIIESKSTSKDILTLSAINSENQIKTVIMNVSEDDKKVQLIIDDFKKTILITSRSIITLLASK